MRALFSLIVLLSLVGCASANRTASAPAVVSPSQPGEIVTGGLAPSTDLVCRDCNAIPLPSEMTSAVESRITALKNRGGDCSRYGTVLETSYRSGRITLRPFMWRVGTHLASGEAKPNGDMMLAREIDSLNVGVRTVDDVLLSMEHEAVHIAFDLASGIEASEVKANQYVQSCKA